MSRLVSTSGFQPLPEQELQEQGKQRWTSRIAQKFVWRPSARVAVPLITTCFCVCEFLRGVDAGVLPSILPSISEEFNATTVDAYWVGSVYLLSTTITEPVFAGLSQAIGRKVCLVIAMTIFIVASALCALAPHITWLIGARMLQGVGAGGMDVSFTMILVDMVTLKQRAHYNSALQVSVAFGLVSGTLIGALLVQKLSWRVVFWANPPIAAIPLVTLILILHIRQERKPVFQQIRSMDWPGILLLSGSLVSLLYAIFAGGDVYPWHSPRILALLTTGPILFFLFLLYEAFAAGNYGLPDPLIPMRLFGNRTAGVGFIVILVHAIVMSSLAIYYPLYWFIVDGLSLISMGVRMLPTAITPFVCAPFAAILMTRLERFKLLNILGFIFLTGGMVAMHSLTENSDISATVGYQFIYSVGLGIIFPTRTMMVQVAQENDEDVPMASSLAAMCLNLGQCFGQALGSSVFQNGWDRLVRKALASGLILESQVITANAVEQSFEKIKAFPISLRNVYRNIGATAVSHVWRVMIGLCVFTLLASFIVKDLTLDRDTEVKLAFEDEIVEDHQDLLHDQRSLVGKENIAMDRLSNTSYDHYRYYASSRRSSKSLDADSGVAASEGLDTTKSYGTNPFL